MDRNSKSLSAEFKAFRFPSTATVNFIATVGFCQERCEPVIIFRFTPINQGFCFVKRLSLRLWQARCPDGWESYGRRRREAGNSSEIEEPEGEAEEITITTLHATTLHQLTTTTIEASELHSTPVDESETETTSFPTPVATTPAVTRTEIVASTASQTIEEDEKILGVEEEEEEEEDEEEEEADEKTLNNIIPVEVPLHLQLIVAPEADRKGAGLSADTPELQPAAMPSTSSRFAAYSDLPTKGPPPPYWRPPPSSVSEQQSGTKTLTHSNSIISSLFFSVEPPPVCTSKATVVTISIVAIILHILLSVAFYVFYRSKRANWAKISGNDVMSIDSSTRPGGLRHSGSISEVVSACNPVLFLFSLFRPLGDIRFRLLVTRRSGVFTVRKVYRARLPGPFTSTR